MRELEASRDHAQPITAVTSGQIAEIVEAAQPYRPQAIHYEAQDVLEYISRDVPYIARQPCHSGVDILLDMTTREPIGWRIYGWSKVAPLQRKTEADDRSGTR